VGTAVVLADGPDYKKCRKDIADLFESDNAINPGADNFPGAEGGGGDIAPMMLRLAWHCSGTWDKVAKNGGSDGATMRFDPEAKHGGNAGLQHARALLEPIKKAHPQITYADLYILAGVVAIEEMAGPKIGFKTGRSDAPGPAAPEKDARFSPDGRLPDGDKGSQAATIQHVRDVFYRMGFNDREAVALCGAHAVGRCHTDRSGYWGPWTYSTTTFSNDYYKNLLEMKWTQKKTHGKGRWTGPEQYENADGQLMMLPSDMALVWDPEFKKITEEYAKDQNRWHQDFAAAYQRLNELGCKDLVGDKPWYQFW
jgi:catalase (peroxidase I)